MFQSSEVVSIWYQSLYHLILSHAFKYPHLIDTQIYISYISSTTFSPDLEIHVSTANSPFHLDIWQNFPTYSIQNWTPNSSVPQMQRSDPLVISFPGNVSSIFSGLSITNYLEPLMTLLFFGKTVISNLVIATFEMHLESDHCFMPPPLLPLSKLP